jgi:hypothetical protein
MGIYRQLRRLATRWRWDGFWFADITGQSLPTLEDSDFAWFDNACSLCHFPLPCTSPKQLDVNCDVVFFCAVLRG